MSRRALDIDDLARLLAQEELPAIACWHDLRASRPDGNAEPGRTRYVQPQRDPRWRLAFGSDKATHQREIDARSCAWH